MTLLQREFYIPCALQTIKKIVNKCLICKKINGRTIKINQNYYRDYRVSPHKIPFREIAIDHIGPFNVKSTNNQIIKSYILIVTCYFSRAVNLLICKNIDSRSFMLAFQEHVYVYGIPSRIISDNGSPIVSSVKFISNVLNDVQVKNYLTENNIDHFVFEPYPAQASYLGGIVESLVKQIKKMVYSTIGRTILMVEDFNLLVKECTMIINKRPLMGENCNMNTDHNAFVITPELLVKGYEIPALKIIPGIDDNDIDDPTYINGPGSAEEKLYTSFAKLSEVQRKLRHVYFDEFLDDLLKKSVNEKSRYDRRNHVRLNVGDLVTIKTKMVKPYAYPFGIVTRTELNEMNEVTAVSIRKANGEVVRRHVTDVILLEKNVANVDSGKAASAKKKELRRSARIASKNT